MVSETLNPNNKAIKKADFISLWLSILQQTHGETVLNMKHLVTA